jgi:uncharacterized membrane protein HdeD (DUF308 family)
MAGMLQIITYLLGIYLVFKGIEIFQIALMSSRPNRVAGLVLGVISIIISGLAAITLVQWQDSQAKSMSSHDSSYGN